MRSSHGTASGRVTAGGVAATLACGLCMAGAARADDDPLASVNAHIGRTFGRIAWSEHARDWRARLLEEQFSAPSALGWVATRLDVRSHTVATGWSFEIEPGQNRFAVGYRIRY